MRDCTRFSRRRLLQLAAGYGITTFWSTTSTAVQPDDTTAHWRFDTDGLVRSSPTIVDDVLYIGSHDAHIYAIDTATGNAIWTVGTEHDISSSPIVINGTVYVGSQDQHVYALDSETGTEQWVTDIESRIMASSPTAGTDLLYVGSWHGGVHALDLTTGREVWTYAPGTGVQRSSPTVVDGTVYVGSASNYLYALNAETGAEQWAFETGGDVRSSPSVVDGTVYVGSFDQTIYAIDAATGDEVWAVDTAGPIGTTSPTVVDETVFIGGYNDGVYALDASTGDEQWTFETSTTVKSSPTVADGIVYIGDSSPRGAPNLYAIDAVRGHLVWRYATDGPVLASPTVVDGTLYIGSYDSSVYAFPTVSDGSSEGSRVLLGTLGHHDDVSRGDPVTPPAYDRSLLADFMIDPDVPVVDEPVVFDASASVVDDGEITAYEWDFTGDGEPDRTGERVKYEFANRGLHRLSLTVGTDTGAEDTVHRALKVHPTGQELSVTIMETNGPVEGGDRLTATVGVTNHGETAHRPEIATSFDGEQHGGIITTVDPGEIETYTSSYRTYPVTEKAEVTIRAEIEGDTAEQTATVHAVDEIDTADAYPDDDLEIQPATRVLFEVESELAKTEGAVHWYVDGDHNPTMGPWHSMYAYEIGREYFSRRFESAGTYEVAAAVVSDAGNRVMRWTVTVTDSGAAPPTIDAARPVTSELDADEQYTLELDVSSPTTDLSRAVWWMTQADTIVAVSEIDGRSDTAAADIDGGCHTCSIEAWLLDANNAYTSITPWQFGRYDEPVDRLDDREGVDVLILNTNSPLTETETVEVNVMLENTESEPVTREITLALGEESLVVATRTVMLAAEATERLTLTADAPSELDDEWVPFRVDSAANHDDGFIHVERDYDE